MSATDARPTTPARDTGLHRLSFGLWIALAGAVVGVSAIASDFYFLENSSTIRDAWFGVPHTADLILASAIVALVMSGLTAADRSPTAGRWVGGIIALVGLLATAQVVYRMIVPPFGGCLTYNCTSPRQPVDLLAGIWMGLGGTVAVTLGGLIHMFTRKARHTRPNAWVAGAQSGMTPWLGLAALASILMVAVTFWPWYTAAFSGEDAQPQTWSGWLSIPHTSDFLLVITAVIVLLVVAAARNRSPIHPSALGATIALLAFAGVTRIAYRIAVPPFHSSAVAGQFDTGSVSIHLWAWLGIGAAVVAFIAGLVQAATHHEAERLSTRPHGDVATGTAP